MDRDLRAESEKAEILERIDVLEAKVAKLEKERLNSL
jgi:hypothetical protein